MKKAKKQATRSTQKEISSSEAADILGCSAKTVTRLIASGSIEGWRITDRGWNRISLSSVMAFQSARRARSKPRPGRSTHAR